MFQNKISQYFNAWGFYKVVLFIAMLQSFGTWFLKPIASSVVAISLILATLAIKSSSPSSFLNPNRLFNPYLYFVSIVLASHVLPFNGVIAFCCSGLMVIYLAKLDIELQRDILDTILNFLAVLLSISSVFWILYLLGINLPHSDISIGHYTFSNYVFFIKNEMYLTDRFSSVFLEPGYLGCLCSLCLFFDNYKFTKRNIIFYISLGLTVSLAGYTIAIIGVLLRYFRFSFKNIRIMIVIATVLYGGWYYAVNYNNGQNWLNEGIIYRLAFDNSTGTIVGDNRSTDYFDSWFWNSFVHSDNLLFGGGARTDDEDVADWKVYVVIYGLVSFVFYILYLISPFFNRKIINKYSTTIFILLNALMFFQTSYGMHWYMYVFVFVLGLGYINSEYFDNTETDK